MSVLALRESRRRLGAACLLVAAALAPFTTTTTDAHATDTSCWGQAQLPRYNSFAKWAEAGGYLPCGGYYTLSLVTSSGTTLASTSGIGSSRLQVYTNWTSCPAGTSVHSYITSHGDVQGVPWSGTATSASIVCG